MEVSWWRRRRRAAGDQEVVEAGAPASDLEKLRLVLAVVKGSGRGDAAVAGAGRGEKATAGEHGRKKRRSAQERRTRSGERKRNAGGAFYTCAREV